MTRDVRIVPCPSCGGTGEAYDGSEWLGYDCHVCEGGGNLVTVDGWATSGQQMFAIIDGSKWRDEQGRFRSFADLRQCGQDAAGDERELAQQR